MEITSPEKLSSGEFFRIIAAAIDVQDEAVVITDDMLDPPGPRIIFVNPAFTFMTGYSRDEVIGKTPRILQGPKSDRATLDCMKRELVAGRRVEGRIVNYRKDGSEFLLEWRIVAVRDQTGVITHYVSVQRDVTEQQRRDDKLRELNSSLQQQISERTSELQNAYQGLQASKDKLEQRVQDRTSELSRLNQQMEDFIHSISHDFRAPLRTVQGFAEILIEDHCTHLNDEAKHLLRAIVEASERLKRMLEALLQFSKLERSHMEIGTVNLQEAMDTAIDMVQFEIRESKAAIQILHSLPPVKGHSATVVLVFVNLLRNAIKYGKPDAHPEITISALRLDGKIRVAIQDRGIGIAPPDQTRIFNIFTQLETGTQKRGVGVGLSLVKNAMQRMQGHVGVDSRHGEGSTFWLEFEAAD